MPTNQHIVIVGAGLCGTLLAIRLAQRGYKISLYEKRPDLRRTEISAGRSINLALSDRGFKALRMVGLEDKVRGEVVPMKARLIHFKDESTRYSPYSGRSHEFINSVSRGGLNALLLDEAEQYENVDIRFDSSCTGIDFERCTAQFKHRSGVETKVKADRIVGADGAGSAVRRSIFQNSPRFRFDFSQNWLQHGYKELSIEPGLDGTHQIEKNVLHIWPRESFMMIALPNLDGSFTVTCFFPFHGKNGFENLNTPTRVEQFFKEEFPDAVEFMPDLAEEFFLNPTSALGTIRCYPWQVAQKVLLMGDAAHAIVPFYGQGMNASFEDVYEFNRLLDLYADNWPQVMSAYEKYRKQDTEAIADLALENFIEMRDHVANKDFIMKRDLEIKLEKLFPKEYNSKYSLVTFNEDMRYSRAHSRGLKQDAYLLSLVKEVEDTSELDIDMIMKKMKDIETVT